MKFGFIKHNSNKYKYDELKYEVGANSIVVTCDAIDEREKYKNTSAANLFNALLQELSKEHKVFFAAYRLPNERIMEIFDPTVILERAEVLLDPFHTFFCISKAKVDIVNLFWAVESTIYFFDKDVKWTDFLASSPIEESKRKKLVKNGKLCGYFQTLDNSKYIFECSRDYENLLMKFVENMESAGYKVSQKGIKKAFW